ncbi:MAG: MOSC domain-containing protein [Roseiflexaceae bacterium]|nr:MOSC domain-containing protein [Roseiflexaceae bacterium]
MHDIPTQVVSVNVGIPRHVKWKGRDVSTGIFKEPVGGPVQVRRLNIDGDQQADLAVHGGAEKAVYAYPAEHYPLWRHELPEMQLTWAMFGENLTTQGLTEETVFIGERLQIGDAILMVTQPRSPCYKLGIRFGRDDMLRRLTQSRRTGFYLSVEHEGQITAGDEIVRLGHPHASMTIAAIADLLFAKVPATADLRRAIALPDLAAVLHDYFADRLLQLEEG